MTTAKAKFVHARILMVDINKIFPAPENEKVYSPNELEDLVPNIREKRAKGKGLFKTGIDNALRVSRDGFIIGGHRRFLSAKRLGLNQVPCRYDEQITRVNKDGSINDKFIQELRDDNRQRDKTLEEKVREEIISANPEEAYRRVVEHRKQRARVDVALMDIGASKRRPQISKAKGPLVDAIQSAIESLRPYWPLKLRQIHYDLAQNRNPLIHASKPDSRYVLNDTSYRSLEIITRGRVEGWIEDDIFDDTTRPITTWNVYKSPTQFIRKELDEFLKDGYCDLLQSQPNHIEILVEKDALAGVLRPVAMEYTMPITIGRGQCSYPPRVKMAKRFEGSGKENLVVLILSDCDPSGDYIAQAYARSMRDDLNIKNIAAIHVAVTDDQIRALKLPSGGQAKGKDHKNKAERTKYKRFVERHGSDQVYELEAIPPAALQQILRDAIDSVIDVDAFNYEIEDEKNHAVLFEAMRHHVHDSLKVFMSENRACTNLGDIGD